MTLGSFLSSLVAGFFSAYLGRKQALWLACGLNAIAVAIQIATTSKGVLYLGRLLLGLANGFFVTFSNVYTAEASPAHLRGVMVALFAYCRAYLSRFLRNIIPKLDFRGQKLICLIRGEYWIDYWICRRQFHQSSLRQIILSNPPWMSLHCPHYTRNSTILCTRKSEMASTPRPRWTSEKVSRSTQRKFSWYQVHWAWMGGDGSWCRGREESG